MNSKSYLFIPAIAAAFIFLINTIDEAAARGFGGGARAGGVPAGCLSRWRCGCNRQFFPWLSSSWLYAWCWKFSRTRIASEQPFTDRSDGVYESFTNSSAQ